MPGEVSEAEWQEHDELVAWLKDAEAETVEVRRRRDTLWEKFIARGVERRTIARRAGVTDRAVSAAVETLRERRTRGQRKRAASR